MRGGCLQPPNGTGSHHPRSVGVSFNEGGLSPAPEHAQRNKNTGKSTASMRGGCLQPPNYVMKSAFHSGKQRFNEGGLSPAPERGEMDKATERKRELQ